MMKFWKRQYLTSITLNLDKPEPKSEFVEYWSDGVLE